MVVKRMMLTILLLLFIIISRALAQDSEVCMYYFYGSGCPHCANVKPFLDRLEQKYPVRIVKFEIYHNYTNYKLFEEYCSAYRIEDLGVPFVAIDDKYFMGDKSIIDNLEREILSCLERECECPTLEACGQVIGGNRTNVSPVYFKNKKLTLPLMLIAGLTDGINPCAFSVLIFLLTYLLSIGTKKKIVMIGTTYILAVYTSYFLAGLGLFTAIQASGLSRFVYNFAAVVAIAVGLIYVKDFFWYGKGFTLEIPSFGKPKIEKFIQMATIPSAVILGFLVSMLELPCTGGIYLAILGMLANQTTRIKAIPYLLFYNFMFILPLIIILLLIYYGIPPDKAEKWRKEKRKWMRIISGMVMLGLGVWMLFR